MSAPNPEEWKATRDEMEEIHGIMEFQGKGRGLDHDLLWLEARRIVNAVARRRALAELRALKDQFDNEDAQNDDNATGLTEAWGIVRKRIAEIEAEAE